MEEDRQHSILVDDGYDFLFFGIPLAGFLWFFQAPAICQVALPNITLASRMKNWEHWEYPYRGLVGYVDNWTWPMQATGALQD